MICVCKSMIHLLIHLLINTQQALGRIADNVQKDFYTRVFQDEKVGEKKSIRKRVRGVPGYLLEVEALGSIAKGETW